VEYVDVKLSDYSAFLKEVSVESNLRRFRIVSCRNRKAGDCRLGRHRQQ